MLIVKCLSILVLLLTLNVCNTATRKDPVKAGMVISYLVNNYEVMSIEKSLATNVVFPISINTFYEGKAKKLYDDIIYLKDNIEKLRKAGASQSLINSTQMLLNRTQQEFDKIKIPYIKKTIEHTLNSLLVNVDVEYLDLILNFVKGGRPQLEDITMLIANAIINGVK